jgi:hypothetical protein
MLLADRRIENWMIVLEDGSEEVLERGWGMISRKLGKRAGTRHQKS